MAGLVPAIHFFGLCFFQDVDARHKAGHEELTTNIGNADVTLPQFRSERLSGALVELPSQRKRR
jgi:hypothetical protein